MEWASSSGLSWVLLLAALASAVLGILVLKSDNSSKHRWFFVVAMAASLWALTNVMFVIVPFILKPYTALASYFIAAVLVVGFLRFCLAIKSPKSISRPGRAFTIIGLLIALVSAIPGVIMLGVSESAVIETRTVSLIVYGLYIATGLVAGVVNLAIKYHRSNRRDKQKITVIMLGLAIGSIVGLLGNLVLPMFGNYAFVQVGPLGVLIFVGVSFYAIARQKLLDVRRAAMRTVAYALSLTILAVIYYAAALAVTAVLGVMGVEIDGGFSATYMALALLVAFLFQPIKVLFDKLTSRLFYRSHYEDAEFIREFGKIILHETDLQFFTKQVSSFVAKKINAEGAFFYFDNMGIMGRYVTNKAQISDADLAVITRHAMGDERQGSILVTDMVLDDSLRSVLQLNRIGVVVPLVIQNELLGFLCVGAHKSRGYTAQDVRVLESVRGELTMAVQNSLYIEEIRELNDGLTRRVNDATKELKSSNRQLQKLDSAKDEFISMASHQLRTPLTSIKGYLDMMLDGDLGKITATQRSVLSEAYISSERMVTLINDFLNVSRLQTGKFIIDKREVDLVEMVREQVQMLKVVAGQHDLKLDLQVSKGVPHILADGEKVRQVVLNMIDNAIYYSKPSTTIDIMLALDGNDIVFSVKDTGIGVPESEKSGLFGKFFRATNARQKRPDGTGVGLFLSRKVILSHGGDIIFWSKEGKGSIFGFRLPIGLEQANNTRDNNRNHQGD